MFRKIILTLLYSILFVSGVHPAIAGTVLENVARSGKLTVGTSFDLVPYAYYNQEGELDGFAIEISKVIQKELEKELGKSIELEFVEVDGIKDAIPKMINNEIDLACNTVFTWQRDQFVDFTMRYSISGIRLLTPKGEISANDSLAGKKIAIPPLTFVKDAVKLAHPDAEYVEITSIQEAMTMLKGGKVDALAGDSFILDGISQQIGADSYEFYPSMDKSSYATYGVACMVPENNSTFLNIANYGIAKMMEGYLVGDAETVKMIDKWIGSDGVITIIDSDDVKSFYQNTINLHEQIPFTSE